LKSEIVVRFTKPIEWTTNPGSVAGHELPDDGRVSFREEVKDTSKEQEDREGVGDSDAELNDLLLI